MPHFKDKVIRISKIIYVPHFVSLLRFISKRLIKAAVFIIIIIIQLKSAAK